ncbi:MAG: metal ABC transporter permease [Gammaproteobacteria bacterium]
MDDFLTRAVLGGIGVALVCGPLGCLVVWQRMAYFGATLSHAALLGIALGLFFRINLQLAILLVSLAVSALLVLMSRRRDLSADTVLGILAHAALALGLLLLTLMPGMRTDLTAYLFGDILAIRRPDLVWIYAGGLSALLVLAAIWRPMLSLIIQRDLALVAGVNEQRMRALFFILLSIVVAVSMQVVGILLIVSLLIIPAATARHFARSPESMALLAALFAALAVLGGIGLSLWLDTPAGASIVVVGAAGFAVAAAAGALKLT